MKNLLILISFLLLGITVQAQTNILKQGGVRTDTLQTLRLRTTGATNGQILQFNGTNWVAAAAGTSVTDLSISGRTSTAFLLESSSGADVSVPAATGTLAGLMLAADKVKTDFLTVTATTDLDAIRTASHAAVTVTDNARLDFTLTGQQVTADIIAGSITATELATNAVTTVKILNSAVTAAKIDQMGATNAQALTWNGSSWAPTTLPSPVRREERYTATAAQASFTTAFSAPAAAGTALPYAVYRNGVSLDWVASAPNITQFTYTTTTVTTAACAVNDLIKVVYFN